MRFIATLLLLGSLPLDAADISQRIICRLSDDSHLLGRAEGQSDGHQIAIDFPMTRVDCKDFGA